MTRMTRERPGTFHCPFCGERDESEFRYGGDPDIARPETTASDAEWAAYLYMRENRQGVAREYWVHAKGCGSWLIAERDTTTHALHAIEEASS